MNTETQDSQKTKQITREHEELRAFLAELTAFLEVPRPELGVKGSHAWAAQLAKELTTLHHKLYRHFRNEERSGVFEEIKNQHRRAVDTVDEIVEQHPRILGELLQIIHDTLAYSQGEVPSDVRLRKQVEDLLQKLSKHEESETDLIRCLH